MTIVLDSNRVSSRSGIDSSLVIFLHGFGANGNDLLGLADQLSEHLPDTVFLAPDGPETCSMTPGGFQWFPIPWIDSSSEEEAERGLLAAADDLNAFLDALTVVEDVLRSLIYISEPMRTERTPYAVSCLKNKNFYSHWFIVLHTHLLVIP